MRALLVGILLLGGANSFLCPLVPRTATTHFSRRPQEPPQQTLQQQTLQQRTGHVQSRLTLLHAADHNDNAAKANNTLSRRKRLRFAARKWAGSLALAAFITTGRSLPAKAKFSYELSESPTTSLRPGMNRDQAELVEKGELDAKTLPTSTSSSPSKSSSKSSALSTTTRQSKKARATKLDFVDASEDDDDEDFLQDDVVGSVGSQSDQAAATELQATMTSNFASYRAIDKKTTTVKVALTLFVPTFGGMFLREFLRRGREEEYVKKGLEILEAQKAEYFNVTGVADDSDVEDELKGLKKKGDDDDDDDDDDDELREKVVFVLVHYIRDSLKFVGLVTGAAELEQLEHAEVE